LKRAWLRPGAKPQSFLGGLKIVEEGMRTAVRLPFTAPIAQAEFKRASGNSVD
jgi:hypothetical protein